MSWHPRFADKVANVVGLYLDPPGARGPALDEKTQIQALDPAGAAGHVRRNREAHLRLHQARHHEPVRRAVATGEALGKCTPNRNAANFLAFLKKAVKSHAEMQIHVVLNKGNLSTHTTLEVKAWLAKHPHVHFRFTPVGSSWLNQVEIWFGIITRQSIQPRHVPQRPRAGQTDPRLHRLLEREREALHLDRDRDRDPREGPARSDRVKKLINNNLK
ncbi:hypothetical protein GCM10010400_27720 [Streptomyces aculeolatus]|uniref:transposase n=1 Tax=Streptomyces aculeolatus TaxID=270689 RepID=UPI001CECA360|nr:transposase [Streptomyces aculeolatus]